MKILIFKTDIHNDRKVSLVSTVFDTHPDIFRWSIDLEDIDKVLKIRATEDLTENEIVQLVRPIGLYCEALPD